VARGAMIGKMGTGFRPDLLRARSLVLLALGVVVVGGLALMLTGLDGFSARSEPSAVERLMA